MAPTTVIWARLALLAVLCLLVPSSARAVGSLSIPNNFAAQSGPNVNASLLDSNWTTIRDYINARELTVDVAANRPAAGTSGRYYFATNTNGGTLYFDTGSTWQQIAPSLVSTLADQLTGLSLSNDGTNPSTTIDITVGAASSDDSVLANRVLMSLTAALTKTTAAWTVGTGVGGLDTGAVAAATWYHVYLIQRTDTGVVDALFSTSSTAPTMPANYTKKRRIGCVLTDASKALNYFTQDGDYFVWATATMTSTGNPGTSASSVTLNTPLNLSVWAVMNALTLSTTSFPKLYVSDLAASDQAPSLTAAPLYQGTTIASGSGDASVFSGTVRTNSSSQIRFRLSASDAATAVRFSTLGWWDRRGRG